MLGHCRDWIPIHFYIKKKKDNLGLIRNNQNCYVASCEENKPGIETYEPLPQVLQWYLEAHQTVLSGEASLKPYTLDYNL